MSATAESAGRRPKKGLLSRVSVRNVRLATGLVMTVFVVTHLVNHSLGLISLETMEAGRLWFLAFWRGTGASFVFMAALLIHLALAFWAIYARRGWRLPPAEAIQLLLGLAIPPLLLIHLLGTGMSARLYGTDDTYAYVLLALWVDDPNFGLRQIVITLVVWGHATMGLYFWLRLKPWFARAWPYLFAVALLLPVFALLGFIAAGRAVATLAAGPGWRGELYFDVGAPGREQVGQIYGTEQGILIGLAVLLVLALAARGVRAAIESRREIVQITYPEGRVVEATPGNTILEASWTHDIPHASVCGGRGRCSTCRVRINDGMENLPTPSASETKVLQRVGVPPNVRLACQTRPTGACSVTPLLPPNVTPKEGFRKAATMQGQEQEIAILFADIRGFTTFSEQKLPYDVVFVLNRYFRSMGEAIEQAGGRVDKFIGDGIMALFGVDEPIEAGSAKALAAAKAMAVALEDFNRLLEPDLPAPMRIGIGIHAGPAIVGEMGYADATSMTAIGDTVNTASRLEAKTKDYGAQLIVSSHVAALAGADLSTWQHEDTDVRGRTEPLPIVIVNDAKEIPAATGAGDGRSAAA